MEKLQQQRKRSRFYRTQCRQHWKVLRFHTHIIGLVIACYRRHLMLLCLGQFLGPVLNVLSRLRQQVLRCHPPSHCQGGSTGPLDKRVLSVPLTALAVESPTCQPWAVSSTSSRCPQSSEAADGSGSLVRRKSVDRCQWKVRQTADQATTAEYEPELKHNNYSIQPFSYLYSSVARVTFCCSEERTNTIHQKIVLVNIKRFVNMDSIGQHKLAKNKFTHAPLYRPQSL